MRLDAPLLMIALTFGVHSLRKTPHAHLDEHPVWQTVDQLCGDLELAAPTRKSIVVGGKKEIRLYSTPVRNAEVVLYQASATDKTCCGSSMPVARTRSTKYGRFELSGVRHGWYWLRIIKGEFRATIPLHVTNDFDAKSCHDPSAGRIFTVDSQPPKVKTYIY